MKKYVITSLLLIVPFMSMAADHCTNPTEYTIDRRCYVTDEQKKEKPYNAVAALIDKNFVYCTGTIVKEKDGNPYLYTAKHCTGDSNKMVRSKLKIKLQDGRTLDVTKNKVGNYNIARDIFGGGDWAIYQLNISDVPSVEITDNKRSGFGPFTNSYNARVVGYGVLKIMSDKEIADFKQKYIKYLEDRNKNPGRIHGLFNGGIDTRHNSYFINFTNSERRYWRSFSGDHELKVSNCKYSSNGKLTNCQSWGGNSGGPIFDDKNAIMGILTRGNYMIGGRRHAGSEDVWFEVFTDNIPILK